MEWLGELFEIVKLVVKWFLGRRERKHEHAQAVAEAEQKLDNAVDNGNTIGELSEAIEDLKHAHQSE